MLLLAVMQNEDIIPNLQQQPGLEKVYLDVKNTKVDKNNPEERIVSTIKT